MRQARAAIYEKPNAPFVIREYPLRDVTADEVLVRVSMSTICRSDIHSYQGLRPNPCPCILGHEIVGRIEQIGALVSRDLRGAELTEGGGRALDPATMKPVVPAHQAILDAGLIPGIHGPHLAEFDCSEVLWFLGRLRTELKTDAFRECEDKAYRWVMDYSVKEFFWRNQGHESMCMVVPFIYTGRSSSYFALYLLECAPAERRDLKLVAELMRFCETRHMDWSRPDPSSVRWLRWVMPNLVCTGIRQQGGGIWLGSRFAVAWAQLGRLDGNRLHAEKARAIMDAITHAQHPVTGSVGVSLELTPRFTRFAINAGRCAWNLMTYADLLAADNKTKGNP